MSKTNYPTKKIWTTEELINVWSKFWISKNHLQVENHSLINKDSSLLFVNSGVAALKPYFLGQKKPPHNRLFNIQNVVRTNDISMIGTTNRHLSFFRMLGNFSFNNYQKKESLTWAWEFLTSSKWLNLDVQKLYVTFLPSDQETKQILLSLGLKEDHLVEGNHLTNFWDLGVGPCGANVEFFYYIGSEDNSKKPSIFSLDSKGYLEIWNVVFSYQINCGNGKYISSPQKNIDTGAGLERLLMVLNQYHSPFMLQEYRAIIENLEISSSIKKNFYSNNLLTSRELEIKQAIEIICDHSQAIWYCLKAILQNQINLDFQSKHGSVIRKLIRHISVQWYFLHLDDPNYHKPFLFKLLPSVFSEKKVQKNINDSKLNQISKWISEILLLEEELCWKMIFSQNVQKLLKRSEYDLLEPLEAFKLVTEQGVPFSLIQIISKKNGFYFSPLQYLKLKDQHSKASKNQKFTYLQNYELLTSKKNVQTIFDYNAFELKNILIYDLFVNQKRVEQVIFGKCWIIFPQTPFFASKGGQASDKGSIYRDNQKIAIVLDVKLNKLFQVLHYVKVLTPFKINDKVTLKIDVTNRLNTCKNHSATHLLHSRLIKTLDDQTLTVRQNGSYNDSQYLRLDILYSKLEISNAQISNIEDQVNHLISLNIAPKILHLTQKEAQKMNALAFFDPQKFAKDGFVRVVNFDNHSIELCGGTHVKNTKEIEKFLIYKVKKIGKDNFRFYALTTSKNISDFWQQYLKNSFLNDHYLMSLIKSSNETQKIFKELQLLIKNKHHFVTFVTQEKLLKKKVEKLKQIDFDKKKQSIVKKYYLQEKHFSRSILNKGFLSVHYLKFDQEFIQIKNDIFWEVFDQAFDKKDPLFLFLFFKRNDQKLFFVFEETFSNFFNKNDKLFNLNCNDLMVSLDECLISNGLLPSVFKCDRKRKQRRYGEISLSNQPNNHFDLSKLEKDLKDCFEKFLLKKFLNKNFK